VGAAGSDAKGAAGADGADDFGPNCLYPHHPSTPTHPVPNTRATIKASVLLERDGWISAALRTGDGLGAGCAAGLVTGGTAGAGTCRAAGAGCATGAGAGCTTGTRAGCTATAGAGDAATTIDVPQLAQNFAPTRLPCPHAGQAAVAVAGATLCAGAAVIGVPQPLQKRTLSVLIVAQTVHCLAMIPPRAGSDGQRFANCRTVHHINGRYRKSTRRAIFWTLLSRLHCGQPVMPQSRSAKQRAEQASDAIDHQIDRALAH
jgi:hypothetical protein